MNQPLFTNETVIDALYDLHQERDCIEWEMTNLTRDCNNETLTPDQQAEMRSWLHSAHIAHASVLSRIAELTKEDS